MGCEAGQCKTSTPYGIFIMTPSLEGWPTKAKEAPSPHEVRLSPLDTNPVFQCLICHATSQDYPDDVSCEFMGESSPRYVTALTSLVITGLLKNELIG